ncbi:MAG TPA: maleylacetoacetate isomerase [Pseudorhodoplanes sp.]|nr:maleylacetoacetate isomerase [Pseudorhodoplanes sp.]
MRLYTFFNSSAAYRVRIALNLKGLPYDAVPVHLARGGGEHRRPEFCEVNPQMRVPALTLAGGETLTQSLAIIEYLEEAFPEPALLPAGGVQRARVRALAQIIACDIHPLNNSGTMRYLREEMGQDQAAIAGWYAHWIVTGFEAIEAMIAPAPYAAGARPGLADICLIPQLYNARRFKVPVERFTRILSVEAACNRLAAFDRARPENQPDAE